MGNDGVSVSGQGHIVGEGSHPFSGEVSVQSSGVGGETRSVANEGSTETNLSQATVTQGTERRETWYR